MKKSIFKSTFVAVGCLFTMLPLAFADEANLSAQTAVINPPPKPQAAIVTEQKVVADASATQTQPTPKQVKKKQKARKKAKSNQQPQQQQLKDIPDPMDLNSD